METLDCMGRPPVGREGPGGAVLADNQAAGEGHVVVD